MASLAGVLRSAAGGRWEKKLYTHDYCGNSVAIACRHKGVSFLFDIPYLFGLIYDAEHGSMAKIRLDSLRTAFLGIVDKMAESVRTGSSVQEPSAGGVKLKDGFLIFPYFLDDKLHHEGPEDSEMDTITADVLPAKMPSSPREKNGYPALVIRWTRPDGSVAYQKLWFAILPENHTDPDELYVQFPELVLKSLRDSYAAPAVRSAAFPDAPFTAVRRLDDCYNKATRSFNLGPTEAVYIDQEDLIQYGVFEAEENAYRAQLLDALVAEAGAEGQANDGSDVLVVSAIAGQNNANADGATNGAAVVPGGVPPAVAVNAAPHDAGLAHGAQHYSHPDEVEEEDKVPVDEPHADAEATQPVYFGLRDLLSTGPGVDDMGDDEGEGEDEDMDGDHDENRQEVVAAHPSLPSGQCGALGTGSSSVSRTALSTLPTCAPSSSRIGAEAAGPVDLLSGSKRYREEQQHSNKRPARVSDASAHNGEQAFSVHGGDDAVEGDNEADGEAALSSHEDEAINLVTDDEDEPLRGQPKLRLRLRTPAQANNGARVPPAPIVQHAHGATSTARTALLERLQTKINALAEQAMQHDKEISELKQTTISKEEHTKQLAEAVSHARAALDKERAETTSMAGKLAAAQQEASRLQMLLEEGLARATSDAAEAWRKLEEQKGLTDETRLQLAEAQGNLEESQRTIEKLEARARTAQLALKWQTGETPAPLPANIAQIDKLETELKAERYKTTYLESRKSHLEKEVEGLKAQVQRYQDRDRERIQQRINGQRK